MKFLHNRSIKKWLEAICVNFDGYTGYAIMLILVESAVDILVYSD